MADWNLPATTTTYVNVLANLKDRDLDSAKLFDGVTVTNPATGMIRWSSANARLEKWSGAAWVALAATHAISISGSSASCTGNAATATALATARTINGVSFDGTANITVGVDATSANTASKVVARDASGNFAAGTITAALAGNATSATTATTLSSYRGNWTDQGSVNTVVGQLAWRLYGNEHTIFDVSSSTTVLGAACNHVNPDYPWGPQNPCLMGFNGTNTFGVRVDSSRYADALATPRTINGVAFDGTANITIPTAPPVPGTLSGTAIAWGTNAKWHATVSANTTFSFSSAPAVGTTCLLHVTHTAGTIAFPSTWVWPGNVAPSLTTGRVHLFAAYYDGAKYRASYLRNYPL